MKAFGKMKHGFALYSPNDRKEIYLFLGAGSGVQKIQTNLDIDVSEKLCGTAEAIHNSMVNVSSIILDRGITKS
jgi:hypothetical protein